VAAAVEAPAPRTDREGAALATRGGSLRVIRLTERAGLRRVTESRVQMGTQVTVTIVHQDAPAARAMVETTFAEIERLESILSRHRADTPVAGLARDGFVREAPPELRRF